MPTLIDRFGGFVDRRAPAHPLTARRLLLAGYRAFGLKLKKKPDPRLPLCRQQLAVDVNRAVVRMLAHPQNAALVSVFTPCELLEAMDLSPMCAELYSAFINGASAEPVFADLAEDAGIPSTYCSYHKVLLGSAFSGVLPKPALIVNTSLVCDANNLTFRALAQYFGIPQYYIDLPPAADEEALRYVTQEMRELAGFLQKQTGRRLDESRLKQAVARSKETVENFRAAVPLRRTHSLPGDITSEMYEIYATHIALGSEEALRYSRQLLADLRAAPAARGIRILWLHTIPNWQPPVREFFNFSDRCQIISCDMNFEGLVGLDPEKPYESMARRLVGSSWNTGERRLQAACDMAKELGADGAVCFCHWGCKQTMGLSQAFKTRLEAQGVPVLVLDGDGCDRRNASNGQVSTRLGAFLEMLGSRKEGG